MADFMRRRVKSAYNPANGGNRMNIVGRSEVRVDAFDKATGRTKYYDDLAPKDALLVRIKHKIISTGTGFGNIDSREDSLLGQLSVKH